MPLTVGASVVYKAAPFTLNEDGSANIVIVKTLVPPAPDFTTELARIPYNIPAADVQATLAVAGNPNSSLLVDLQAAIYGYLVNKGVVPSGTIS